MARRRLVPAGAPAVLSAGMRTSRRRRLVQAAVIAALVVGTATALVLTARPDPAAWTGGLVTPPHVTLDPSDAPDGAAVATGVVVDGQELVL